MILPHRRIATLAFVLCSVLPSISPAAPGDAADAEDTLRRLDSADAAERRVAAVRLKNLAPEGLATVQNASERNDLSPGARTAINAALPTLKGRASVAARSEADGKDALQRASDAYDRVGRKDGKWDTAVKAGLALYYRPSRDNAGAAAALRKAVWAGCNDPLVQYLLARADTTPSPPEAQQDNIVRLRATALDLAKSDYPADLKVVAAAQWTEAARRGDRQMSRVCQEYLPAALAGTSRPWRAYYDVAAAAFDAHAKLDGMQKAIDDVLPVYQEARPDDDPGPHLLKGIRNIDFAWEARGIGLANTVTREGWKLFGERLAVAREALEAAFERDAEDSRAPGYMITVCMGESSPRPEMEKWFRRAVAADPDDMAACRRKLGYLYPRWHGSNDEMIAFGRECVATENWWGPLPIILVEAYEEIARNSTDDPKALYRSPDTWRDIRSVYGAYLEAYPGAGRSPMYRNLLARWACRCERWPEATELFEAIGDNRDPSVFPKKSVYDYYRRKAARLSAPAPRPSQQVRADP